MKERTSQILESIVREFIDSGEPVSSEHLYGKYDFGVKPATIRTELAELTDLGFLEQPHHSSGRIPTNRGYEFFANIVLDTATPEASREITTPFTEGYLEEFLEELSRELNVLGVLRQGFQSIHKDGLDNLFSSLDLEWRTPAEVKEIVRDFEKIDERLGKLADLKEDFLDVFIGKESPVTRSDELSVIAGDYFLNGERMFLLAIGPKRMDYEKPVKIFRGLKQLIN